MHYKIGEIAKKTGCRVVTVRYYEKEGLLPPPERTEGNYRLYSEEDLERLKFIMHCRKHGMNLSEVKALLAYRENPAPKCAWVRDLIGRHIDNIEEQIASLNHLKEHLEALRSRCTGDSTGDACAIMKSLADTHLCGCETDEHGNCCTAFAVKNSQVI